MKLERIPPDPFDPAEDEAALQRAEADIAAGRVVPQDDVAKWLRTWGAPDEKPMPPEWRR